MIYVDIPSAYTKRVCAPELSVPLPFLYLSMEFLKPKGVGGAAKLKQQLLTVGDAAGNLHVYDVPQNLWRPLANERAIMSHFLEREIKVTC